MFFGVAERISTAIVDAEHPHTSVVIIRMSQLGMLDATGAHTLAQIIQRAGGPRYHGHHQGGAPRAHGLLANVGVFDSLRHENHSWPPSTRPSTTPEHTWRQPH